MEPWNWQSSFVDYALNKILPEDLKETTAIKMKGERFYYDVVLQTLYVKSRDDLLLHCISKKKATEVLEETHNGTCRAHHPEPKLWDHIRRLGYFWPEMIMDNVAHTRHCHACWIHANFTY